MSAILDWMTPEEAGVIWGIKPRRVQVLYSTGRINGVVQVGRMWLIPRTATKPVDGRTKDAKNAKCTEKEMRTQHGTIKFADLFCGIGGFRLGMESAGFECTFSCDIDAECRKTYAANFADTPQGDIRSISAQDIPDFDVLCAGFPCQPFSISGKQKGFADDRGTLFFEICRFIEAKRPKVVLLENVKHLVHHDNGRTLAVILDKLRSFGYIPEWRVLNALDFGAPQNRERIVIVASSAAFDFNKLSKRAHTTLLDFLDSTGDFEYLDESKYTLLDNPCTQPESGMRFAGYINKSTRKTGARQEDVHLSRVHKQPYRIYSVHGAHPTLHSQEKSGRFWVCTQDNKVRKLTLSECFRIMGFPEGFNRPSPISAQYRQVGNSLCVPMIVAIAGALKEQYFSSIYI